MIEPLDDRIAPVDLGQVGRREDGSTAVAGQSGRGRFALLGIAPDEEEPGPAAVAEALGHGQAETLGSTRDQGDTTREDRISHR